MKEYMMRVSEETHNQIVEMAKKDFRKIGQEMAFMIDFAYKNMNNPVLKMADAMAPQKGMTPEEVKETPKYKELEEQLAALKQEAWEINDMDINTSEEMNEMARRSKENKDKQAEIQNQMRAMLNV